MQKQHRSAIQNNFKSLVEQTDLDVMVAALYEKGVFSELMIEPYKDTSKDVRMRKRQLYLDIPRRGPDAFHHLVDALSENGYWDLVRDLDPSNSLHLRSSRPMPSTSGESSFFSLSAKHKSGKEQHDPNKNRAQSSKSNDVEKIVKNSTGKEPNANTERVSPPKTNTNQKEIPQFNVIKSTKFFEDSGSDIKLYRTRGRKRGVLVLFNYIEFKHQIEDYRKGARQDADNLRYLFSELGFRVLFYLNLSVEETHKVLSELKHGICGEGAECVFIVFSSHGHARLGSGDVDIRCSDGRLLSFYSIIDYFNNDNFPALKGVPKVFIFQTCRGSNYDYTSGPTPPPLKPPPRAPKGTDTDQSIATDGATFKDDVETTVHARDRVYSDILIAHSTVPRQVSNRDQVSGSWYIQAVCDVFAARAHDCHVETLFTLVDERMRTLFNTQTSSIDRWGFNKRLYLHPGLFED